MIYFLAYIVIGYLVSLLCSIRWGDDPSSWDDDQLWLMLTILPLMWPFIFFMNGVWHIFSVLYKFSEHNND